MQIGLSGCTAPVAGSTQGTGHAIAVGLARAGARVVVNGRCASTAVTWTRSCPEPPGRRRPPTHCGRSASGRRGRPQSFLPPALGVTPSTRRA